MKVPVVAAWRSTNLLREAVELRFNFLPGALVTLSLPYLCGPLLTFLLLLLLLLLKISRAQAQRLGEAFECLARLLF